MRLNEGDPDAQLKDISEIKLDGRWTLEKDGALVLQRCSPEEERKGCKNITSPRFSVKTDHDKVLIVLHNVTDSDAVNYVFQVAGHKEESFNVTVGKHSYSIMSVLYRYKLDLMYVVSISS